MKAQVKTRRWDNKGGSRAKDEEVGDKGGSSSKDEEVW